MEENTEESLTMMLTILLMILSPMILDLVKECCGTILRILRNLAPLLTLGASSRRRTPKKSTDVSGMRSLKEPRFSTRRSRHRQLRHGGIGQHSTMNSLLRHRHRHQQPRTFRMTTSRLCPGQHPQRIQRVQFQLHNLQQQQQVPLGRNLHSPSIPCRVGQSSRRSPSELDLQNRVPQAIAETRRLKRQAIQEKNRRS